GKTHMQPAGSMFTTLVLTMLLFPMIRLFNLWPSWTGVWERDAIKRSKQCTFIRLPASYSERGYQRK
ncbi:MAG: hypothetical protein ACE363_12410, partial [Alphaproteobacteria bacterium]